MIKNREDLTEYLRYERSLYRTTPLWLVFPITSSDTIYKYLFILRNFEYHLNCRHDIRSLLYRIIWNRMSMKTHIQINPNTFGKGLKICHLGTIVVNRYARVGENAILQVDTGIVSDRGNDNAPYIGDNFYLGMGSIVMGKIKLADNVTVGANATVNKSFEESGITLVGSPAHKTNLQRTMKGRNDNE